MELPYISREKFLKKIKKCDYNATKFSFKGCETWAWCSKVYDGDTIHACFFINKQLFRFSVRLYGIDTAELRSTDPIEKDKAITTKNFVTKRIANKPIYLRLKDFDKYGRLLGVIYQDNSIINNDSLSGSLNQEIIDNGLAYAYYGGTKKK